MWIVAICQQHIKSNVQQYKPLRSSHLKFSWVPTCNEPRQHSNDGIHVTRHSWINTQISCLCIRPGRISIDYTTSIIYYCFQYLCNPPILSELLYLRQDSQNGTFQNCWSRTVHMQDALHMPDARQMPHTLRMPHALHMPDAVPVTQQQYHSIKVIYYQ